MERLKRPYDPEAKRAYYRKNAERLKAAVRARWRSDPDAKAKDKARRDAKRDKIRAYDRMRSKRDREKRKPNLERWLKKNPERARMHFRVGAQRRRARILYNGGEFTAEDVEKAIVGQKNKCWWCSKKMTTFHVDHRIPLAKGGRNDAANIVISCPPCNLKKNAQMPWEFAGRLL